MSGPEWSATRVLMTSSLSVSSRVLHGGTAFDRQPHPRGAVAVMPPGEIVFYCLRTRTHRAFVFRTLGAPEALASEVPGVSPAVRLLVQTQTLGRLARLEELALYLARAGRHPSSLSDAFYLRLNAIVGGRLPGSGRVIRSLVDHEEARTTLA